MKEWKAGANTEGDIIQYIAAAAANYTPEWNFSLAEPDIGAALAYIYADMTEDTLRHAEHLKYKNRRAFFNSLGAAPRSASPAKGYAVLNLVDDAPCGTEVDAHTGMTAPASGDGGGTVRFETQEDLYVTPAQPVCLYLTDGLKDGIYRLSEDIQGENDPIVLFREKGENLQRHELYLAHDEILGIQGEACVEISLFSRGDIPLQEESVTALSDSEITAFSYWTGEEWQPFSEVSVIKGRLLLRKEADLPAFGRMPLGGSEAYVIRCQVRNFSRTGQISAEQILLGSRGANLRPQYIYGAAEECSLKEFFPFGERMNLYEEVYFGSEEALTKRGARITLSFFLDFARIPSENMPEDKPIEWKWIMKQSEFQSDPEYDITVEEVIWEYYNGNGWGRLFPDGEYKDIFRAMPGVQHQKRHISFICPQDIAPILVNSCETCYIRARVLKVNNLYKLKGKYIAPIMGNPMFSYDYGEERKSPRTLCAVNNGEQKLYSGRELKNNGQAIRLITGIAEKERCLYLGFRLPPVGAPVRMLWEFQDILTGRRGGISWEYENSRGFREMSTADLTGHFARSGSVTFVGQEDFCRISHFGQEMYWIRLRDESGFYSEGSVKQDYPVLRGLWMNAVEICHMEREETERFTLEHYEENCCFHLTWGNIQEISVEVLERGTEEERWVQWEEVPDLELSPGESRVYQVDRTEGTLRFGNGSHGQVPPSGKDGGIRVHYKCGGGSRGNVEPGKINKLNRTVGFVSSVSNPMALWGGLEPETPSETMKRYSARLRHMDRAVTARDYEELAMEASRVLQKVRCFGGINEKGEREAGAVTLVICPGEHQEDKNLIQAVKEDIRKYLEPRMDPRIPGRGLFFITEPKRAEIVVRAEVTVEDFQDIFSVRRRAKERICAFLNPASGHFHGRGWDIGQFPEVMQLQNILREIPEITWISKITLMAFIDGPRGRQEADPESIRKHPFVLPYCGETEVVVKVKGR